MSKLGIFNEKIKKSLWVRKTRITMYQDPKTRMIERRLWIWFMDDTKAWLMKEEDLTGNDRKDLVDQFHKWLAT